MTVLEDAANKTPIMVAFMVSLGLALGGGDDRFG